MPVPPALPVYTLPPKRTLASARPSPLVSWSATRNPPAGGVSLPQYRPLQVLTYTTPFGATTRCRAWPMLSANTVAQNPAGSVMPPLSAAQVGFVVVGCASRAVDNEPVASTKPMMRVARRERRDNESTIRIGFMLLRRVRSEE